MPVLNPSTATYGNASSNATSLNRAGAGSMPRRGGSAGRSVAQRHPGATINSAKGRVLSMQTAAMRVPPAKAVAPQGGGPTFANSMPSSGGIARGGSQSSPRGGGSSRRGLKSFTYPGGLKSPGQFQG
jgi:hypothetical protein